MQDKPSFLGKLFSQFTLVKKFIIISVLFALAILVPTYWMLSLQNENIKNVYIEIIGKRYEKALRNVYELISKHAGDPSFTLNGQTENPFLTQLEATIEDNFNQLINYDSKYQNTLHTLPQDFEARSTRNLKPIEINQKWEQLIQKLPLMNKNEINKAYLQILNDLQDLMFYVADTSNLLQDSDISNYYMIHTLYWLLSKNLKDIPAISIKYETYIKEKKIDPKLAAIKLKELEESITLFKLHLIETKEHIQKIVIYEKSINNNNDVEKELLEPYQILLDSFQNYAKAIENSTGSDSPKIDADFVDMTKNLYLNNINLSNVLSDRLDTKLVDRWEFLRKQQLFSFLMTLVVSSIAFIVGVGIFHSITQPLKRLINAASSLGEGDLSTRVPVIYDDEIGKVAKEFNKMADSLQDLLKQLQWAGIQLTTSTTEIAATAKQQEVTVVEQESTTKEIAVTAKEISATTKDFAKTMKEISNSAEKTSSLANFGKEGLLQMELTMRQMVDAASNIAAKLAVLNEKASTITGVVTTIAKVADQTNLLSLNAAIEAEKAGEHGRSFAVIAREIRRLADQTANATLDIEKMINEMVSAVSAGVMGVDKFSDEINTGVTQVSNAGEQLTKIIEQVQQLTKSIENVNEGMQAQSIGAEQINESIVQLSETAQQTSESIRQFHKSIEQLNHAAQELQSMVSKVKK